MIKVEIADYVKKLYGRNEFAPCPFTDREIAELSETNELLVYLPAKLSMRELCDLFEIKANVDFDNERMIRNVMTKEDNWFICSASERPELLYQSARKSQRRYEDESLHGMDFRRYLAFLAMFRDKFGQLPDQQYWTFLHSGSYDRSGISIVGFDRNNVLNHHGWMKDFRAKFVGSRYVVLPPRIEITEETEQLSRAYRGRDFIEGREAVTD